MDIKTRLPCFPAHILTAVLPNSRKHKPFSEDMWS